MLSPWLAIVAKTALAATWLRTVNRQQLLPCGRLVGTVPGQSGRHFWNMSIFKKTKETLTNTTKHHNPQANTQLIENKIQHHCSHALFGCEIDSNDANC